MIELRRAVPEDLDCLFEAANSAFAGSTVSGKGPRWKRSREFLGDCLAEQECWCILLDGRTVGGLLLFPQADCLWLEGAFVEAGHQGEGIGSRPWGSCSDGTRRPHGGSRPRRRTSGTAISMKSWALRAPVPKPGSADRSSHSMKKIRILSEKPLTERDFSYIIIKLSCFLRQQVFYNIKGFGPPAEED